MLLTVKGVKFEGREILKDEQTFLEAKPKARCKIKDSQQLSKQLT